LHQLVDLSSLGAKLAERIITAEESIYTQPDDPMVNWDVADLQAILAGVGFTQTEVAAETVVVQLRVGSGQIDRWFGEAAAGERLTYGQRLLLAGIEPVELEKLKEIFSSRLENEVVGWHATTAYGVGQRARA
jgi:hypothetical protein